MIDGEKGAVDRKLSIQRETLSGDDDKKKCEEQRTQTWHGGSTQHAFGRATKASERREAVSAHEE